MRDSISSYVGATVIVFVILAASVVGAQGGSPLQWDISTYIWASSISEDLILDGDVVGGGDTSFNDLIDLTESSYQIHIEMKGETVGFFVDAMSIDLSDQEVGQFLQTDGTWTVQTGAGWLFGSARRHAVFFGYRHRELQFEKADVFDVEKTVSGPLLGVNFGF